MSYHQAHRYPIEERFTSGQDNLDPDHDKHESTSHAPSFGESYFYYNNCDVNAYSHLNGYHPSNPLGYLKGTTVTSGPVHHAADLMRDESYHDLGRSSAVSLSISHNTGFEPGEIHPDRQSSEPRTVSYTRGMSASQAYEPTLHRLPYNAVDWTSQRVDQLMYSETYPEAGLEYPTPLTVSYSADKFGNGVQRSVQVTPYHDATVVNGLEEDKQATNDLFFNTNGWLSGKSLPTGLSSSSALSSETVSSIEDQYINTGETHHNINVELPISHASTNGLDVAYDFLQQRSAYQGKPPMDRPLWFEQSGQTSASIIGNPLPSLPDAHPTQWRHESRVNIRARPGRHHPVQRPSNPQVIASPSSNTVNANLSSRRFAPYSQTEPSYSSDDNPQHFSARFRQPVYFGSGYQFIASTQPTNSPSVALPAESEDFYGPSQPDPAPLQSTGPLDDIPSSACVTNQVARATLYPSLKSPLVSHIRRALPPLLDTCFRHSRPEDDWQLVLEAILNKLSTDASTLAQYDTAELARLLKSRCEERLFSIQWNGPRGGLSFIVCSTNNCTRQFDKHNVARDFTHHLVKEHWNFKPFMCHIATCRSPFSFPGDRARHEKSEHGFTYEIPN